MKKSKQHPAGQLKDIEKVLQLDRIDHMIATLEREKANIKKINRPKKGPKKSKAAPKKKPKRPHRKKNIKK